MDNPKVSIIIPVYNGADFLQEAIDSALSQTYSNCEVIVVNDGSNDNQATENIALSYGNKINYYKKSNGGVASALNLGLDKMQGEYFSWLSHDDIYYPEKIEYQINILKEMGEMKTIVFSWFDLLYDESNEIVKYNRPLEYDKDDMNNSIYPVLFNLVNGCTVLIHKSHFERTGNFDEQLLTSQDYDMWFRMFRKCKLLYIDKALIKYRIHNKQGTQTISEFSNNCQNLYLDMMRKIDNSEIDEVFAGKYKFYYHMMKIFVQNKWYDCYQYAKKKFLTEEEPNNIKILNKNFKEHLMGIGNGRCNKICLFCAGKNAKKLLQELNLRNIDIDCFSDNDSQKWGTYIDGIKCVPISELDKFSTLVIVTKDDPENIKMDLMQKGFIHITTYDDIRSLIYKVIPIKKKVIDEFKLI